MQSIRPRYCKFGSSHISVLSTIRLNKYETNLETHSNTKLKLKSFQNQPNVRQHVHIQSDVVCSIIKHRIL